MQTRRWSFPTAIACQWWPGLVPELKISAPVILDFAFQTVSPALQRQCSKKSRRNQTRHATLREDSMFCSWWYVCAQTCTCVHRFCVFGSNLSCFHFWQVLPYAIKNLIHSEMQWIAKQKAPRGQLDTEDPTHKYQRALIQFIEYVWLLRRKRTTLSQCLELAQAGLEMKKTLMRIFPHKSGMG